jgi:ribosomal protein L24
MSVEEMSETNSRLESKLGMRMRVRLRILCLIACCFALSTPAMSFSTVAQATQGASATSKAVGTVKSISGNDIVLSVEGGGETNVVVGDGARLLRIEPGETDLKKAVPLQLADLQAGDRILVRGSAGPDGKSLLAASVIAMKKADLAERHAHEQQEWQRHGIGGLVSAVNPATGTVTVATSALGANKSVVVHVSKSTVLRRYAPGSVKFDDATAAPIDQIKAGDQLRARGQRSGDGGELSADEIVSGSFRNISGTVNSVDAAAGTITVADLTTKKPVVVKINESSQLRKLPAAMAQRIAARLKGNSGDAAGGATEGAAATGGGGAAGRAGGGAPAAGGSALEQRSGDPAARGAGGGGQGGQGGDLQQAISRMPASTLADLQKGDAVMIVATAGDSAGASGSVVAITLLSGVEPILQASPTGQSILTPWSMSGAPGGDAAAQ